MDKKEYSLPTGKDHISFSELKDHIECSYRHKLKYIDNIDLFEENVHTNFGEAIHAACEDYIKTRGMKYQIALDIILQKWKEFDLPDMGQFMLEANAILEEVPKFLDKEFPGWECFEAEEELYEPIDKPHNDVSFKGYIDGVIKYNNQYHLIDWKCSSRGWNNWKKNDDVLKKQLVLYAEFWANKHNIDMSKVNVAFIILNRDLNNMERIEMLSFPIDNRIKKSLKVLNNSLDMIKRNIYFKQWKYSEPRKMGKCRFCDFNRSEFCP